MNEEHMELELVEDEILEPYPVRYSLENMPPEGRCSAVSHTCKNPECDYMYDRNNLSETSCNICGTERKVCGKYPRKGINNSGRCEFHGGAVPSGVLSPSYRGRSISQHLPTRLMQIANLESRQDRVATLDFHDDLDLLEIRKMDLLRRLDTADSREIWKNLRKEIRNYRKFYAEFGAGKTSSGKKSLQAIDNIEKLVVRGSSDRFIWEEVDKLIDSQRKLRVEELKRKKESETSITESDARSLIASILRIISDRIKDQDLRKVIINDFQSIMIAK